MRSVETISTSEQAAAAVSELFAGIESLSGVEAVRCSPEGVVYATPDGKLYASAIERNFAGKDVEITELPIAKEIGERAIERWYLGNSLQAIGIPPLGVRFDNVRYHPQTRRLCYRQDFFQYAKRSRGVLEAVDPDGACLIIKPRRMIDNPYLGGSDRHWVNLLSSEGQPLVDVTFL